MTRLALLLADPSPCLRYLVLHDLLNRPEDDAEQRELVALRLTDPLVFDLFQRQRADGSWTPDALGGTAPGGALQSTAQVLTRLGYFGFGPEHPAVARAADFIFSRQVPDGSWPLPGDVDDVRYDSMPLQTALPLYGLAWCGYASDTRSERAYEWLLGQLLPEGVWPTGRASGVYGYVGGYRRLAHSRWGCRSNTTAAALCFALHPTRRKSPQARRALDLLLGRETRERHYLGFEVARIVGAELPGGWITYFARVDLALLLSLCSRIGFNRDDQRVADLVRFIQNEQGPFGLWKYHPRPQISRWITFDLLRSLRGLDTDGDWIDAEPRTPFRPYRRGVRRF